MKRIKKQDILSMKLLHYFIVKKNYKPIIVNGVENEIWLENDSEDYKIIRIVLSKIINKEQYELDNDKISSILSQIKKKTLSISMKVLSFYMNMDDELVIEEIDDRYKYINVLKEDDIYDNEIIIKHFNDIKENMTYDEKDNELFVKLVSEIGDKNIKESEKSAKMFKNKDNKIFTIAIMIINIIIFALMYILGKGSEDSSTLIKFGANVGSLTRGGDYYRLITSAFLHIGVIHLLCNLYSLFMVGPTVEYFYGKLKFILIYLYSAITAALFVLIFHVNNTITPE